MNSKAFEHFWHTERNESLNPNSCFADEKHKLMGALLLLKQVDPAAISGMHLENPYLRAMVKSLAGEGSWNQIVYDSELPMLERLVLAIRFLSDDSVSFFSSSSGGWKSDTGLVDQHTLYGVALFFPRGSSVSLRNPRVSARYRSCRSRHSWDTATPILSRPDWGSSNSRCDRGRDVTIG